ncbi:unnamed protein product [Amoebophrya sp. A120]|nr:unnamed protein product [Amoebophrya sp. A120]|eukprot:GSA120T00010962001.1
MSEPSSSSSAKQFVTSTYDETGSVVTITLKKEPVNSMSLNLWKQLHEAVAAANASPKVRAILFQSGLTKNVFTAGLELKELYPPTTTQERHADFWQTLTKTLAMVYGSPKATIALINGACPAGGCGLSLCCDLRIITEDGSMGLNEVQIGLLVPEYWAKLMVKVIGNRNAERVLTPGLMCKVPELKALGMIDQVVPKREDLLPAAMKELQKNFLKLPPTGFRQQKEFFRQEFAKEWADNAKREGDVVWACINEKQTMKILGMVMQKLSGGKPVAKL